MQTERTELRRGLPELPARVKKLPIDARGYPIPWFVAEVDGVRDFRMADGAKRVRAANHRLCWLCGEKMGRYLAFVIGPMCAVNRNTSEPACHRDCALFAVQSCPFLMRPAAQYRTANMPEGGINLPHGLGGNPGASCIWITETFKPYRTGDSWLIRIGEPIEVLWWAEGKPASRQAILDSFDRRLPLLRDMAKEQSPEAEAELQGYIDRTMALLPVESSQAA